MCLASILFDSVLLVGMAGEAIPALGHGALVSAQSSTEPCTVAPDIQPV